MRNVLAEIVIDDKEGSKCGYGHRARCQSLAVYDWRHTDPHGQACFWLLLVQNAKRWLEHRERKEVIISGSDLLGAARDVATYYERYVKEVKHENAD